MEVKGTCFWVSEDKTRQTLLGLQYAYASRAPGGLVKKTDVSVLGPLVQHDPGIFPSNKLPDTTVTIH